MLEDSLKKENEQLKISAKFPRTMYGQLAIEKLKMNEPFIWKIHSNNRKVNFNDLNQNKLFQRAIALTELYNYADLEIRNLYKDINKQEIDNLFTQAKD